MAGPMLADAFGIKLLPSTLSILWTASAIPSACKLPMRHIIQTVATGANSL